MSRENVDLIRKNFARFQAGDAKWKELVHPEIEWDFSAYPLADIPTRGRGRGDVLTQVIETYYSGWRGYEAEITEMIDAGDDVVVIQHEVVRVADSDRPLERDTFHVWTVRDRKWVRWLIFPDRDSALEAAGLSESAMSRENVEVVRRSFDAIARGDVETLLGLYDRDVRFLPLTGTQVESGGYRGHDGVRAYFAEVAEIWEELRPYGEEFRTTGDKVVVIGGCAVRGKGSGVVNDSPLAWVIAVRDGKITSHRGFRSADEALEAAGLPE